MTTAKAPDPFNLSPDPDYLYHTPALKTALHKLSFVIETRQGATAILGDLGLGKSSLLRTVYRKYVARDDYRVAFIPTPSLKSDYAFLLEICKDLKLPPRRSLIAQQDELQQFVLAQYVENRNVLLLLDEGQRLDYRMLEVLRVLLNFETDDAKLIQVVVSGQLELKERLMDKKSRALKSRIFAPTILSPLSLDETAEMMAFRCGLAKVPNPFTADAVEEVYVLSEGVPREAIALCRMAYEFMRINEVDTIDADLIRVAKAEARLD
jgi:general secretion pathway protein A